MPAARIGYLRITPIIRACNLRNFLPMKIYGLSALMHNIEQWGNAATKPSYGSSSEHMPNMMLSCRGFELRFRQSRAARLYFDDALGFENPAG